MKTTILSTFALLFACTAFGQNYIADGSAPVRTRSTESIKPAATQPVGEKASLDMFAPASVVDTTRRAEDIESNQIIGIVSSPNNEQVQVNAETSPAIESAVAAATEDMEANKTVTKEVSLVKANLKASDYKAMLKDFTASIKADPKSEEAFMGRAVAHAGLKDYKDAIADFNEVIRLNPLNSDAFYNRGLAKMNIGDFQGGINDMTKVIRLKPADMDAYYNRAMCKMYLDQINDAIMDFTVVIKMNPDNADAYLHRGILKFDNEDWKGACRDWSQIAGRDERAAKAMKKYCQE